MPKSDVPSIHEAIESFDDSMFEALLALYNCNVNMKHRGTGRTLLHTAVDSENYKVLNILLHLGADVNVYSNANLTPLHLAVANQSKRMVEILLNHGAYVNPSLNFDNKTPLYMAVELDCAEIAVILLSTGASINRSTIGNVMVLDVAWQNGNIELFNLLVDYSKSQRDWDEFGFNKRSRKT